MVTDSPRIRDLRRRVESDPASIAFAQLAEEYRRVGDVSAAERVCRAGLNHHPAYISARVTLGRALVELGRMDEAAQELQRVITLAPDNLAAMRALADMQHRQGNLDAALEYYQRALRLAQQDEEIEMMIDFLRTEIAATTVFADERQAAPAPPADAVAEPAAAPRPNDHPVIASEVDQTVPVSTVPTIDPPVTAATGGQTATVVVAVATPETLSAASTPTVDVVDPAPSEGDRDRLILSELEAWLSAISP